MFFFSRRTTNDGNAINEEKIVKTTVSSAVTESSGEEVIQVVEHKLLGSKDNLISPRLVANGTKLIQSWEDQYYVVNEYRANAHQV